MAQTNYTPISLYYSTTAAAVPVNTNLVNGELAINITDGKLYYKNNSGVVTLLAGAGGSGIVAGSNTQLQFNNNGVFGASASLTWSGTVLSTTGLTATGAILHNTTTNAQSYTTTGAGTITISSGTAGTINNMSIGATTALAGTFTDLTSTGNTTIGNAATDTITVNGQFVTGTILRSAQTATNTLALAAYDTDGAAYTNLITLTASTTPTLALTSTGVGTINNMSIGATTASTGAFTTLSATGVATFSAGTAALPAITTTGDTNTGIFFPAADTIAFTEGGAEAMRIDSSGNLLLGSTTNYITNNIAQNPKQLIANTGTSNLTLLRYNGFGGSGAVMSLAASAGASLGTYSGAVSGSGLGTLFFGGDNGTDYNGQGAFVRSVASETWSASTNAAYLSFGTTPSGATAATEKMRIDSSGNVGIGTSSPANLFEVSATSAGANVFLTRFRNAGTTTATQVSLLLTTNTNASSTASSQLSSVAENATGAVALTFGTTPNGSNPTERMRIDSAGNVGIGVTPSAWSLGKALEIAYVGNALWSVGINNFLMTSNTYYNGGYKYAATGTATHYQQFTGQHQWWNAPSGTAGTAVTFTQAMTLDASGRLLLGTTSASGANLLQVNSDASIYGLTVGRGAGAVATNTAFGTSALAANTTGTGNVAAGSNALNANTTGNNNVALGGFDGTTQGALKANTTGTGNIAIGTGALAANTTASGSVAVGHLSLLSNTTGAQNLALGQATLYQNSSGGNNVALGYAALFSNTTSSNSTSVGHQAGYVATGAGNQLFGYSAGSAITSGAKNVILGSYTGSAAPISATGSNYIVLSDGDGNVRMTYNATGVGFYVQAAITSKAAVATLTGAEVLTQILNTTGTTYTVTMPTGTALDTATGGMPTDTAFNFTVINTASGTITMAVNTNITNVGSLSITTGTSATYKIRKTAANTFIMYRT